MTHVLIFTCVLTLVMSGLSAWNTVPARAGDCAGNGTAPYVHTCGAQIVDAAGTPVRLRALNWYGFDSNDFVAGGLRYQTYQAIVDRIKALGYNALRIPLSNELIERDPVVSALGPLCVHLTCLPSNGAALLGPNSALYGLDALSILKTIVDYAGQQGLYVILDDHRSEAGWGPEENGLWYTSTACPPTAAPYTCYTPQSWLDDWARLGHLFQGDPAVIGMDLRNEPHSEHQPTDCASYLRYAHWGACRGANNAATDWPQAATAAGNLLLSINPHWLIFVEGVSTYPQIDGSFPQDGWGENLQGVASDPVTLNVPNQLVYSPHDYRWEQSNDSVDSMYRTWTRAFGFITLAGQPFTAPLWMGEFGTCTHSASCAFDTAAGQQSGFWFSTLLGYMDNPPGGSASAISWSYWPVNGTYSDSWSYRGPVPAQHWQTCYGQREDYGVLAADWSTVSLPLVQSLLFPPSPTPMPPATATPLATDTATPTNTATAAPSATSTISPTATLAATRTTFPLHSPTAPPRPDQTPSITAIATTTATAVPTTTVTPPATATITTTPVITTTPAPPTATITGTATATPTLTPVATAATGTLPATPTPPTAGAAMPIATGARLSAGTSGFVAADAGVGRSAVRTQAVQADAAVSCTPYHITPTPTATPTILPSPGPTATPTQERTPTPGRVQYVSARIARSTPVPTPGARSRTSLAISVVMAHGSALHGTVWLDVRIRRNGQGAPTGTLVYGDRHARLRVRQKAIQSLSVHCGSTQTAAIVARMSDTRHTYTLALRLSVDRHHVARIAMHLGRRYSLSAILAGRVTISCLPAPRQAGTTAATARKAATRARPVRTRQALPASGPNRRPHRRRR